MNPTNQLSGLVQTVEQNLCNGPKQPYEKAVSAIRERYGDAEMFLKTFNPDIQWKVAAQPEKALLGKAPSLRLVDQTYSPEIALCWLEIALEGLNDFCGVREKSSMQQAARLIMLEYPYLKITEISLFLYRFKCGRYGEFFGAVDPLRIMCALMKFTRERQREISDYLREKERRKKEKSLADHPEHRPISYDEYIQWKARKKAETNGPSLPDLPPEPESPE